MNSLLTEKKSSKYLVLRPGARRTYRLSSRTPQILFYILSLTENNKEVHAASLQNS